MTTAIQPEAEVRAGPRKKEMVEELTEKFSRATSAVITDYRGLTVKQLEELRHQLRAQGIDYVVVKNTLARRAADAAGIAQFSPTLVGPCGVAVGYGELSAPAKILNDYFKANKRLPIMGGIIAGTVYGAEEVKTIADLPPREVLLSQLAGTLQSPLNQLAGTMNSILSNFAATLDAYRTKLEKAA